MDRSWRDPKSFADLVPREIKRQGWQQHYAVSTLMNAWPELVGDKIARHTEPVKYDEKQKVLVIQCDSTSWATQLTYMQTQILQTFARRLGPDVVVKLKILRPQFNRRNPGKLRVKGRGPRDDFG